MNVNDLKQSKYLTKADVEPPILVTCRDCTQENLALPGEEEVLKWVLHFDETEKPMVLGPVTGGQIAAVLGSDDSENWAGQKVVLFNDKSVVYKGKVTGGIRVRAPRNQAKPVASVNKPVPAKAVSKPAPEPEAAEEEDSVPF